MLSIEVSAQNVGSEPQQISFKFTPFNSYVSISNNKSVVNIWLTKRFRRQMADDYGIVFKNACGKFLSYIKNNKIEEIQNRRMHEIADVEQEFCREMETIL